MGRITYCIEGGARILPVNYILANDSIIFRTVPDGEIYSQALSSTCAFEIDETDDFLEWGWSVVVVGRLQLATENDFAQMHYSKLPDPWATGNCQHHQFAWKCGVETAARCAVKTATHGLRQLGSLAVCHAHHRVARRCHRPASFKLFDEEPALGFGSAVEDEVADPDAL